MKENKPAQESRFITESQIESQYITNIHIVKWNCTHTSKKSSVKEQARRLSIDGLFPDYDVQFDGTSDPKCQENFLKSKESNSQSQEEGDQEHEDDKSENLDQSNEEDNYTQNEENDEYEFWTSSFGDQSKSSQIESEVDFSHDGHNSINASSSSSEIEFDIWEAFEKLTFSKTLSENSLWNVTVQSQNASSKTK